MPSLPRAQVKLLVKELRFHRLQGGAKKKKKKKLLNSIDCLQVVVQSLSCVQLCDPMDCSTPGSPVLHYFWSSLKFMPIESVIVSNHLILCCPLLLLPSVFPIIKVFSNESALHIKWPKYWSFSFSISPSKEYAVLISFRIDWASEIYLKIMTINRHM